MNKNKITFELACALFKYKYQIWDVKAETSHEIDYIDNNGFSIFYESKNSSRYINFEEIGTDYKIICYPLGMLTKSIEGIGVPIVELANISVPKMNWEFDLKSNVVFKRDEDLTFMFWFNNDFFVCSVDDFSNRVNYSTQNQRELHTQLHRWHFDLNFPKGTTINKAHNNQKS